MKLEKQTIVNRENTEYPSESAETTQPGEMIGDSGQSERNESESALQTGVESDPARPEEAESETALLTESGSDKTRPAAAGYIRPEEIEKRSFEIIRSELRSSPPADRAPVILRAIHATADFEYEDNLVFSPSAVLGAPKALRGGLIVTDTNMVLAGINKAALKRLDCRAECFMADPDVAEEAARRGVTRAVVSMEKAALLQGRPLIFAVGNAPTALLRLADLIETEQIRPALVVGVPVGFVNVVESKERLIRTAADASIDYIVARGRKGGSTVAAAIINALLYMAGGRE